MQRQLCISHQRRDELLSVGNDARIVVDKQLQLCVGLIEILLRQRKTLDLPPGVGQHQVRDAQVVLVGQAFRMPLQKRLEL